jgi:5'-3' exonuclease
MDLRKEGISGNENFIRHIFLNKLLSLKKKMGINHQNIFICCDHKINWRKQIFPYYKASRAKHREESDVDFQKIFKIIDEFYRELKAYFPFYVFRNEMIEADDWIAVLAKHFSETNDPVVVVSTDRDFYQLQKYPNVMYQWDHINGKQIKIENPINVLKVKVLRGDPGDGVPNVMSDDDTFVCEDKRQKSFGEKKAWKHVLDNTVETFIEENNLTANFKRNDRLINFDKIPKPISDVIIKKYVTYEMAKDGMKVQAYFHQKNLQQLLGRSREFFE